MQVAALAAESVGVSNAKRMLREAGKGIVKREPEQKDGKINFAKAKANFGVVRAPSAMGIAMSIFRDHPKTFFRGLHLNKVKSFGTAITFAIYTKLCELVDDFKSTNFPQNASMR